MEPKPGPQARGTSGSGIDDAGALALLGGYFLAQLLIRAAAPGSLELDEGAELVRTQYLLGGYDDQPPLYTWLLYPLIQVTGPSVWALALLKNLLLLGTFACVYGAARRLALPPLLALAASVAMLWLPQIGWESQRDLTHSVLVTFLAAAMLLVAVDMAGRVRPWHFPLLGALAAAGLLAKYNFVLFLAALLLAGISLPAWRRRLSPGRILIAAAVALPLLLPHGWWLLGNWDAAAGNSLDKLGVGGEGGWVDTMLSLLDGLLAFVGPFLLVALLVLTTPAARRRALQPPARDARDLVDRYLVVAGVLLLAVGLVLGIDQMKARWLQPLLFPLPLALVANLDLGALPRWRQRGFAALLVLGPIVLLAGRAADIHASAQLERPTRYAVPFPALVARLDPPVGGVVLAGDAHVGGALRLLRPDLRVYVPGLALRPPVGPCLLVWGEAKKSWRQVYLEWAAELVGPADLAAALAAAGTLEAPYPGGAGRYTLHFATARCGPP